jgi:hypothetical protein
VGSAKAESRGEGASAVAPEAADFAVAHLNELSPDLRGCALLDATGTVLSASGEPERWAEAAVGLFAAADAAGPEPAEMVHVGTEDGEAFALRHRDLAMVAVTDRFSLASLVIFDMRTILRDLAGQGKAVDRRAGGRAMPADGEEDAEMGGWPAAEEI